MKDPDEHWNDWDIEDYPEYNVNLMHYVNDDDGEIE